ncbi:MAG: hypothetical protein MK180_02060 [Rhodobacteraceae bacterium]|nr:hypothetical protein [Paracoccaceae bacterium]
MRQLIFAAVIVFPTTLAAEEEAEGSSLMERGMGMFLEGLLQEMEPALEGFEGFAQDFGPAMGDLLAQMGPALSELLERVDDLSNYESPEMLPNGDIIIRRKPDAPEYAAPEIGEDGAVEL